MRGPALAARVERCWRNGLRSVTTIAAKLESTKGAVSHALSRLRQKGTISGAPLAGRPRISSPEDDQRLGRLVKKHNTKPLKWLQVGREVQRTDVQATRRRGDRLAARPGDAQDSAAGATSRPAREVGGRSPALGAAPVEQRALVRRKGLVLDESRHHLDLPAPGPPPRPAIPVPPETRSGLDPHLGVFRPRLARRLLLLQSAAAA